MHPTSFTGIMLVVIVALLLFGPSKLPELGRAFGKTLREFKNGAKDLMTDEAQGGPNPANVRKDVQTDQLIIHEAPQASESR